MNYEEVKIKNLKPGAAFYRADPRQQEAQVLPDYNVNLTDDPEKTVWIVYPDNYRSWYVEEK
jgi:hypothetical protein